MAEIYVHGRAPADAENGFQFGGWMEQVQELTERNAQLLMQLDTKDIEIAALEEKLIAMEPIGGHVVPSGGSDPRDAKIIDLSKKNRTLNMALQKKKNKYGRCKVADLTVTRLCVVYRAYAAAASPQNSPTEGRGSEIQGNCRFKGVSATVAVCRGRQRR